MTITYNGVASTRVIACIANSQGDTNAGFGIRPTRFFAPIAAGLLTAKGVPAISRLFGVSGETTAGALARLDVLLMYETPDIAVLEDPVNDPGAAINTAATTANLTAAIKALKYGAGGPGAGLGAGVTVAGQAGLPDRGAPGQRYVVLADTSTTGGALSWHPSQAATIPGACPVDANGQQQSVWEYRYGVAGEMGWGRVAIATTQPTACQHIVLQAIPYNNFTAGGDSPTVPLAANATLRAAQQAAVVAENVPIGKSATVIYSDLYNFMKARIVAGVDLDFTSTAYAQAASWHWQQNNQHLNTYGQELKGISLYQDIIAAWPTL